MSDEIHFLDIALVADDSLAWSVKSTEHVDDQLVGESSLAFVEEVVERLFELLKNSRVLDELSLHLGGDLLVENKFFNDQVEIVHESLLHVFSNIIIKGWLDVEWLV